MILGMGIGPAGSLLGGVALALVPMPVLFYYCGAKLRERSAFAPTLVEPCLTSWKSCRSDFLSTGFLLPIKTAMIKIAVKMI